MGLLEQQKVAAANISFQTRFNNAFSAIDDPLRMLGMEIPSDTDTESHNWLGTVPGLSEWTGDRKMSSLRAEGIVLKNKDWANGIRINRNTINDDKLGIVAPRIDDLARKAALHYGDLMVQALVAGFSTGSAFGTAYDGAAFFSAAHQDGDGPTQTNYAGATALDVTAYYAARAAMWSLTDESGDPLGIVPDTLIVGPTNEKTALEITAAPLIADGGAGVTNVAQGSARVIVSPRLTGAAANHWFLASMSGGMRPMILQIREAIRSSFVNEENSEIAFMRKELLFGSDGRHAAGYGLWQFIHGSNA